MTRAKISQYSATANDNTDVNGVNIAEGCPPSSMNNMGREIMAALKRFQVGSDGDGVTVGGSLVVSGSTTANTFSATNVSASGNLTFTGTGNRITGDFSNATVANRTLFQTSTTNGQSRICVIPNGTADAAAIDLFNNSSDQANCGLFSMRTSGVDMALVSNRTGTGTYIPMTFYTGGSERLRIDTSGNVGIGTTTNAGKFHVRAATNQNFVVGGAVNLTNAVALSGVNDANNANVPLEFRYATNTAFFDSGTERMRIDSGGNLLVGTTTNNSRAPRLALNGNSVTWSVGPSASNSAFVVYNASEQGVFMGSGSTSWSSSSDERLKTDLIPINDAVEKVKTLRSVTGRFKSDEEGTSRSFLIAQDFLEVFPEAVDSTNPESLGLRYTETIPLLVAAIQELKAELDTVKAELATLKG